MPSRLGHGLYKKIDRLKNIFRYITICYGNDRQSYILIFIISHGRVSTLYQFCFVSFRFVSFPVSHSGFYNLLLLCPPG